MRLTALRLEPEVRLRKFQTGPLGGTPRRRGPESLTGADPPRWPAHFFGLRLSDFQPILLFLATCLVAATAAAQDRATLFSTQDMTRMARTASGLCVQIGWPEERWFGQLTEANLLMVQVLEPDETKVKQARETLQGQGLYGRISVERWSLAALPQADNLVNLVVVDKEGALAEAEALRVLAPRGSAWFRAGSRWRKLTKPWPAEYDEWTHARHGADGNMVSHDRAVSPPTGLRWVAGPPQDSGGKRWYYDHALVSAYGRNFYLLEDAVVARDAFNGSLLWERPARPCTYKEKGTEVPPALQAKVKVAVRTTRVKPVATATLLYLAAENRLMGWDARTGETEADFGPLKGARDLLVEEGRLVVAEETTVSAYDLATRQKLWTSPMRADRILAGDMKVYCICKGLVVALNLATGRQVWWTDKAPTDADLTCTSHQGVLVVERSSLRNDPEGSGVFVYRAQDGRLLWWSEHRPDMTHWQEARSFFAGGLLWLQLAGDRIIGLDPVSGQQRRMLGSRGKHCAAPVATERYFIAPECEFTDFTTGGRAQARMFKSACRLPFVPANGLLYSFPVQCECFPMLRGYMGLAGVVSSRSVQSPRLERGPAYGRPAAPSSNSIATAEDWPIYRHDIYRSGALPLVLRDLPISAVWTSQVARPVRGALGAEWRANPFVPGTITAPVAVGGRLYLAVPDEHRLVALDAAQGQPLWQFTAGGRIDTPPTIQGGLCLFGAHDGWVYCLDATTGELAWRFRGAPAETRIMAYGQLESPWPVPGSLLALDGVAYGVAGRHPRCDDGVHVFALRVATGELVWEKVLNDLGLAEWYAPTLPTHKKVGLDFEPVDLMVKDGSMIAMSRWKFEPATGRFRLSLASTEYDADGALMPRGLWGYGIRQNKSVQPKPPAVFSRTWLHSGSTNSVALLLAGDRLVKATPGGLLDDGRRRFQLEAPPVHDGLIGARGRIYAALRNGAVVCLE